VKIKMVEQGLTFAEKQKIRREELWREQRAHLAANPNAMNSYAEAATIKMREAAQAQNEPTQPITEVAVSEIVNAPVVMTVSA